MFTIDAKLYVYIRQFTAKLHSVFAKDISSGWDRSFHAADGTPLVNNKTFPSLRAMTAHGHARGLRVGW